MIQWQFASGWIKKSVDFGGWVAAWEAEKTASCVSPGFDWTHDWVKGAVLSDDIIMLVSFLIAEGDTGSDDKVEAKISMAELDDAQEETNVIEG